MKQSVFKSDPGFADSRIQYVSGTVNPADLTGSDLTDLNALPRGSFYSNSVTGVTFKKKGNTGNVIDWKSSLDKDDLDVINVALTALGDQQVATAALLLSARKESSVLNVTAATVIDEIATQQADVAKWIVYTRGTGANSGRRSATEVLAVHNGDADTDADDVNYTAYAETAINEITDLAITVVLSGVGAAQRMQLKVTSPTVAVDVYAVRERLPGIDTNAPESGGDNDSWTPGDPNIIFSSATYTPDPNIVF